MQAFCETAATATAVQAAAHSVTWRRKHNERLTLCWLAEMLAEGSKDRSCCELMVMADLDRELNPEAAAACSLADLEEVARDGFRKAIGALMES